MANTGTTLSASTELFGHDNSFRRYNTPTQPTIPRYKDVSHIINTTINAPAARAASASLLFCCPSRFLCFAGPQTRQTRQTHPLPDMAPGRSGPKGPLQTALQESTIAAATTRATEGQSIFGPFAAFLEQHRSQTSGLRPHLQSALASLSDVLAAVAQRHFNAFISGIGQENLKPTSLPASRPPTPPPS